MVSAALLFIYLCCTGITADGCVLAEFLRNDCGITLKSLVKRNIGGNYIYNIIKKKSVRERVFFSMNFSKPSFARDISGSFWGY